MPIEKKPEKNAILFVWFNHYSGVLVRTPSKMLVIDPVDIRARSFPNADAVLITHEHYDHLDQRLIAEIQKATDCTIIADPVSAHRLQHVIPPKKLQEIRPGEEIKVGEVSVKAEECNHPAAAPVTYIITSEDGVKIFHTADSLPFQELTAIGEREKFDVVFCTVGIAAGTSPETGFEIARLTTPQVAVPYHTNSAAYQHKFAAILKKELPKTVCLIPELNKIYQVSKRK
ncbi:MAG: MBL fold metallo-hydrolase [Candidatus Bathyarchaeota archaeon]|nr:MAG: MBL fold metallo-hydrolase [Candidatus Bathyarchaeota archaeon]